MFDLSCTECTISAPAPQGPGLGLAPPSVKIRESVGRIALECSKDKKAARLRLFRVLREGIERVEWYRFEVKWEIREEGVPVLSLLPVHLSLFRAFQVPRLRQRIKRNRWSGVVGSMGKLR